MSSFYDGNQNSFSNAEGSSIDWIGIKSKLEEFDALNDEIHRKKKKLKKIKEEGRKGKEESKARDEGTKDYDI